MKPPEHSRPVLFLDRNFGKYIVPGLLRNRNEIIIEIHDDYFRPDAPDHEILSVIGQKKWFFLSKDVRIMYSAPAKDAIIKSGTSVFLLAARGDLQGKEAAEIIIKAIPRILKFIDNHSPPFIAKITRDSKVRQVDLK